MPEETVDDELSNIGNGILSDHSQNVMNNGWDGKQEPLSDEERPLKICENLSVERRNSFNSISIGKSEPMDEDPLACTEGTGEMEQPDNNMQESNENEALKQNHQVIIRPLNNVVRIAVEEQVMCVQPPPAAAQVPPPLLLQIQSAPNPITVTLQNEKVILPEQVLILQQHLRQHIQIATSNFLQLFINPLHWAKAPTYKEYLETLLKMVNENPSSVVNVCNLHQAVELVHKWEESVSKDTPENTAMVEFIQKEAERWRRNTAYNKLYVGEFHETFNKVVANSPVFLYPYLLPPMPYAADSKRRFSYLRSEDELIAIGLDQFWKYVDSNPDIFRRPPRSHPRHRWGLVATAELVVRYMFPWLSPRTLVQHVMVARRQADKDNPIYKYFNTNEITPVKHKLLPYNPKLTLYEQPENEMPRCWLRYLSKTSKRFKVHLRRRQHVLGQTPTGVEISMGALAIPLPKEPLPIDFTKEIRTCRTKKTTNEPEKPVLMDKFDVDIQKKDTQPPLNFFQLVQTNNGPALVPLVIQSDPNTSNITLVARPNTSVDNLNVPKTIEQTNTVNCNNAPITSAIETNIIKQVPEKSTKNIKAANVEHHCCCCIILKRITKTKQTVITDFFRNKDNVSVNKTKCQCNESRYPTVTKKLKLLILRYKSKYKCIYEEIQRRLGVKKTRNEDEMGCLEGTADSCSGEDLADVSAFQQKLTIRGQIAKNIQIKSRINTLFSRFDVDADDPIKLALELDQTFNIEMVDVFKEFCGFLNPEQADKINRFRDYFIHNCVQGLMEKIEEQVKDKITKESLLRQISAFFSSNQWTPCSMCSALLILQRAHPELARYTFALFPHASRKQ
ncbi:unnamed protein product [Diatraea saccharalis]|nr:unnamed protein product [Diatraea saccharalis]